MVAIETSSGDLTWKSAEIEITKRIRQYAAKEQTTYSRVNNFDNTFNGAAALWPDWGYGDNAGNYLFKDAAAVYDGELLKAICLEPVMHFVQPNELWQL